MISFTVCSYRRQQVGQAITRNAVLKDLRSQIPAYSPLLVHVPAYRGICGIYETCRILESCGMWGARNGPLLGLGINRRYQIQCPAITLQGPLLVSLSILPRAHPGLGSGICGMCGICGICRMCGGCKVALSLLSRAHPNLGSGI